MLIVLAIASGLLQALGYFMYITKALRHELEPNAATWLMFAYGTATLTILEWDRDAHAYLLVLPVVCAVLSLYVAYLCWKRGALRWKGAGRVAQASFIADVGLTVAYVALWFAAERQLVSESVRLEAVLGFLVLSNLSTIVQFVPLMHGAYREPSNEHPLPWTVWTSAYLTLGLLTYLETGTVRTELMLYPTLAALLHGSVAALALRRSRPRALTAIQ